MGNGVVMIILCLGCVTISYLLGYYFGCRNGFLDAVQDILECAGEIGEAVANRLDEIYQEEQKDLEK